MDKIDGHWQKTEAVPAIWLGVNLDPQLGFLIVRPCSITSSRGRDSLSLNRIVVEIEDQLILEQGLVRPTNHK